jgi:hypothetical protein
MREQDRVPEKGRNPPMPVRSKRDTDPDRKQRNVEDVDGKQVRSTRDPKSVRRPQEHDSESDDLARIRKYGL